MRPLPVRSKVRQGKAVLLWALVTSRVDGHRGRTQFLAESRYGRLSLYTLTLVMGATIPAKSKLPQTSVSALL